MCCEAKTRSTRPWRGVVDERRRGREAIEVETVGCPHEAFRICGRAMRIAPEAVHQVRWLGASMRAVFVVWGGEVSVGIYDNTDLATSLQDD